MTLPSRSDNIISCFHISRSLREKRRSWATNGSINFNWSPIAAENGITIANGRIGDRLFRQNLDRKIYTRNWNTDSREELLMCERENPFTCVSINGFQLNLIDIRAVDQILHLCELC